MQPDPKAQSPVFGDFFRTGLELILNCQRSGERPGCRVEHREDEISRHVDHPSMMAGNAAPEDRTRRIERGSGCLLVRSHEA
jgi:hypothetical protein